MVDIDKIITEVINNNVNNNIFTTLQAHINPSGNNNLLTWMNYLKNAFMSNSNSQEINTFLMELYNFTNMLVQAIQRCVARQSLNEAFYGSYGGFDLGQYGMKTPSIIGQTANAFINGFNGPSLVDRIQRLRDKFSSRQSNTPQQQGRGQGSSFVPPKNTKLQVILTQYFPLVQRKYNELNRKYNNAVANLNPSSPQYIIGEVNQIISELGNAQRNTP